MAEATVPRMRDSDVIFLIVKRLDQVATMMTRYEYGPELDRLVEESAEMLEWLADWMQQRNEASHPPPGEEEG